MKFRCLLTVLALSGCVATNGPVLERKPVSLSAGQIAQVKAAVERDMRDPSSAQYQNIQARRVAHQNGAERLVVCGAVNAKNGYGGYTGFMAFGGEFEANGQFTLHDVDVRRPGFTDSTCRVVYGMTTL